MTVQTSNLNEILLTLCQNGLVDKSETLNPISQYGIKLEGIEYLKKSKETT